MGLLQPDPHYTVDDYLQWEGRWELWYGRAVALASPATRHGEFACELIRLLRNELRREVTAGGGGCRCQTFVAIDWRIAIDVVVRPDLSVVCGERIDHSHINRPPTLIVELLSPSTRDNDLIVKRNLYAVQGVAWYLILDPSSGRLTCLHLGGEAYTELDPLDGVFSITLHDGCDVRLPSLVEI